MNINDIKKNNRTNIYSFLRDQGVATKQDISYGLQLSLPTVSNNLIALTQMGLVSCEKKLANKTGGRNPVAYSYLPKAKVAIGIDIARHHVKSVMLDLDGNIMGESYQRIDYRRDEAYLELIGETVQNLISKTQVSPDKVLGVGIAVPGLIDPQKQRVVDGRVIDNSGMGREDFSAHIPYKVKLIHDSEAAGFSEICKSPDIQNACYISLCGSIGGAVFINSKAYRGDGLFSCENGHLNLIPNGKLCYCGQRGCFDPYCNAEVLSQHTQGDLGEFFEKLRRGDEKISRVWKTYIQHLTTALTEIRMMFGCRIIIGGDVGAFIDEHMEEIYLLMDEKSPFNERSSTYVLACQNKREAVTTGAALAFVQDFLEECFSQCEEEKERSLC